MAYYDSCPKGIRGDADAIVSAADFFRLFQSTQSETWAFAKPKYLNPRPVPREMR